MSKEKNTKISLPELDWKSSTCKVCGNQFDYLTRRRPATCNDGLCRYKYHYQIEHGRWAGSQISLFSPDENE